MSLTPLYTIIFTAPGNTNSYEVRFFNSTSQPQTITVYDLNNVYEQEQLCPGSNSAFATQPNPPTVPLIINIPQGSTGPGTIAVQGGVTLQIYFQGSSSYPYPAPLPGTYITKSCTPPPPPPTYPVNELTYTYPSQNVYQLLFYNEAQPQIILAYSEASELYRQVCPGSNTVNFGSSEPTLLVSIPVGADGSNSQSITVQQNGVTFTATGTTVLNSPTQGPNVTYTPTTCQAPPPPPPTPTPPGPQPQPPPSPPSSSKTWWVLGSIAIAVLVLFIILIVVMIHRRKT